MGYSFPKQRSFPPAGGTQGGNNAESDELRNQQNQKQTPDVD